MNHLDELEMLWGELQSFSNRIAQHIETQDEPNSVTLMAMRFKYIKAITEQAQFIVSDYEAEHLD